MDRNGNLYGTTSSGGDMSVCYYVGCGIVFELTKDTEGNWNEKILHEMTGSDGSYTVGAGRFRLRRKSLCRRQFGATTAWDQSSNSRPPAADHGKRPCFTFSITSSPTARTASLLRRRNFRPRKGVWNHLRRRRILQFGHGFRNHAARECFQLRPTPVKNSPSRGLT